MRELTSIIAAVRENAEADFVGLWEIASMLDEDYGSAAVTTESMVAVVRELLKPGDHVLGDFRGSTFVPWPGSSSEQLDRLTNDLTALGRAPDIGEVGWLAAR
jgi:hypothetical protein